MDRRADRALRHLALRLAMLRPALAVAVDRRAAANARLHPPGAPAVCIGEAEARALVASLAVPLPQMTAPVALDVADEDVLRAESARAGEQLPLDVLAAGCALDPFEIDALVLAVAPELDGGYGRLHAYLLDELGHRGATIELIVQLAAGAPLEPGRRRFALGPLGRLRRFGLLEPAGAAAVGARVELRPSEAALAAVLGTIAVRPGTFCDPEEMPGDGAPTGAADALETRTAGALAAGRVDLVGIYGRTAAERVRRARAVASAAGLTLRRIAPGGAAETLAALRRALLLDAAAFVDLDAHADADEEARRARLASLEHALLICPARVILAAQHPRRPTEVLAARRYFEIILDAPELEARARAWAAAVPELSTARQEELAARMPMGEAEIAAAGRVAHTRRALETNGTTPPLEPLVDDAAALVAQRHTHTFASVIRARRGPLDLILPAPLHAQVLELARFHRTWPRVADLWDLARMQTGRGGVKALFTGDPGTGKTLAAEVIAGLLGIALVRVDLARVVSKWVGETEKNLASAFDEAEQSHAVLFFDEADALFGRRGEVRHGADRYANLEVSYLLQRLEDHGGLVILASNLENQVDPAFLRRFQAVLHFPRPGPAERRRIWELALPQAAPRSADVDLDRLAGVDLTGAAIVSAGRTAALLAASRDANEISPDHLVEAIRRELHRDGRFFRSEDLGVASPP